MVGKRSSLQGWEGENVVQSGVPKTRRAGHPREAFSSLASVGLWSPDGVAQPTVGLPKAFWGFVLK